MILTTIQPLEPPMEPFLDSPRLGAGQTLRREFFSNAGLGTGLEKEGAYKGPSPLLLPALHPRPHRAPSPGRRLALQPPSCLSSCPRIPRPQALIYLGLENVVRHLDTHWAQSRTNSGWEGETG